MGLLQKAKKVVSIDGYEDVPVYDENALKKAVAHQPVSVAIEAGGMALQLYESVSTRPAKPHYFCSFSCLPMDMKKMISKFA